MSALMVNSIEETGGIKTWVFNAAESLYSPSVAAAGDFVLLSTDRDAAAAAAKAASGMAPALSDEPELGRLDGDVVVYLAGMPLAEAAGEWLDRISATLPAATAETARKEMLPVVKLWLAKGRSFITVKYSGRMAVGRLSVK